jgi:hypothetical protein
MTRFSPHPRRITNKTIQYVCREMLGLGEWRPDFHEDDDMWSVLTRCGSLLEIAYLVGAYHYMEQEAGYCYSMCLPPACAAVVNVNDSLYRGVWFLEPWHGFGAGGGPSAMAFLPQYPVGQYKADFALAMGDDNGSPRWSVYAILEINGYAVHRTRREKDERRALAIERSSQVPVLQFLKRRMTR